MQVIQAVFGVFHHFELAHQLHARKHLRRLYSTWPWARLKREGLPHELIRTQPLLHTTHYLLGRTPVHTHTVDGLFNQWVSLSFDRYLRRRIEPCDALIAISGAGLTTGPLVQSRGGKFICDRGSTHQRFQYKVLAEEYDRWKVPFPEPPAHIVRREEGIYAIADAITVGSNVARRSFIEMGVAAEKIHVIPYGVRLDKFAPTEAPPADSFEVLFAGQIGLRKGIPYLLEAFARLRHPHKRLNLVGSVQDDIRGLLPTLPTEHVTFTGSIPQAALARRMSASHVLVLPSIEEGFGMVMAQAMACGCPVIGSDATGVEHLFADGEAGFIVPIRDTDTLAGRLQQIADDSALQLRLGAAAQECVKNLGGWDRYGEQWDTLLHALTGQPKDRE
jgi:glycosyltransferase involved in cell wall biosynthesis